MDTQVRDGVAVYATHSAVTDPGPYHAQITDLAREFTETVPIAQGLVYHYMAGKFIFGYEPPQERMAEIDSRHLARMLERILALDGRPLDQPRDFDKRIVGCCRDFSLVACALLRQQAIPARLRYGFGSYFVPGYWIDHVIAEVWTGDRWRRFDPQMAGILPGEVDLWDISEDAFVTGDRAWQMCRQKAADPTRFGLGPDVPEVSGWWFIRGRMLLDMAALHKQELLCWDQWSYGDSDIQVTAEDEALLDRAAVLMQQPDLEEFSAFWQSEPRLRVPDTVTCFSPAVGPHQVIV